jgi:hypothetical protein
MILALMGAAAALPGFSAQKSSTATPNISYLVAQKVKELLLLMDTDKNGKISRQEWMDFMSAEFDRLDTDKSGELDPKELTTSRVSLHTARPATQGK